MYRTEREIEEAASYGVMLTPDEAPPVVVMGDPVPPPPPPPPPAPVPKDPDGRLARFTN